MIALEEEIIEKALGENSLPVKARMGEDPGQAYFVELIAQLKCLCDNLSGTATLSKELAYALYCLGHYPYVEYSSWVVRGKEFRGDLIDPQVFQLEMAIENVFNGEWSNYFNKQG